MRCSLFLSFLLSFQTQIGRADEKTLKIGVILALTGDAAAYGESVRNGITLALEDFGHGKGPAIEVLYEDDRGMPTQSVASFRKLLDSDGIDLAVCMSAQPCMALAPLAETAKKPLVAIAIAPKIVKDRKFAFLFFSTAERLAEALVQESVRRGYKQIARVSSIHDGRATIKGFADSLGANRLVWQPDEDYVLSERDFRTFLTRLRTIKNLDAIHVNLFLGQIGVFAKQAKELGIHVPLITTEFFRDPNEIRAAQGALEGQWYVDQRDPAIDFAHRYQERFSNSTIFAAPNGYDLIKLTRTFLEVGRNPAVDLPTYMREVRDFSGTLGVYSATSDNRFDIPVEVKVVSK